ncbi:TraB/GumN family protein [Oceanobacillus iheyensis]|uniref:TraB/GumN family protein n=2 Tax=Oceanobacillus kimchii TaxID=746691 RepID=UPI0009871B09
MPKMKFLLYSVFLMIVLTGCVTNDESPNEHEKMNEETGENTTDTTYNYDGDGGFLWKIDHEETTAYIHGSIHLGHVDYYPLSNEIEEAYASSDIILPEINMFEVDITEEELNEMAIFDDGKTLDEVLSEDVYNHLSDIFKKNGVELESLNKYEPWYIETLLSGFVQEESDLSAEYGVDLYFLQQAIEDNKEIMELETVESQYDMLTGFSLDTQTDRLETFIETYEVQAEGLNNLGYHWINSNTEEGKEGVKESLSTGFESSDDEFQQEMNDNRNIDMANKIDDLLQSNSGQTYFAIIGTAHTVIEPSVPSILKEKGYDIERIY